MQRIKVNGENYDLIFRYFYVLHLELYYLCIYDVIYDVISVHAWCKENSRKFMSCKASSNKTLSLLAKRTKGMIRRSKN